MTDDLARELLAELRALREELTRQRPAPVRVPATIDELERILNSEDDAPVEILPDGTVRRLGVAERS